MKLRINFLKPFSDAANKNKLDMDFNGKTLEDLLVLLVEKYPKLKREFYTKNNELTENMCIFINDKPIYSLNGMFTYLKNEDKILFFTPVSGG